MKWSKFSNSWVGYGVVGNLLEKYWFLDSFGADLGEGGAQWLECRFWGDFPLFDKAWGKCCGWMSSEVGYEGLREDERVIKEIYGLFRGE